MTSSLQPPASSRQPAFGSRTSAFGFLVLLNPAPLLACATCYGQSDSPMARGMNWGIFSLLVVVATVLATFVGFFIYLARRSANLNLVRESVLPGRSLTEAGPAPVARKHCGGRSPDLLGLPQQLDLAGGPFLPTRPESLPKSARAVP